MFTMDNWLDKVLKGKVKCEWVYIVLLFFGLCLCRSKVSRVPIEGMFFDPTTLYPFRFFSRSSSYRQLLLMWLMIDVVVCCLKVVNAWNRQVLFMHQSCIILWSLSVLSTLYFVFSPLFTLLVVMVTLACSISSFFHQFVLNRCCSRSGYYGSV